MGRMQQLQGKFSKKKIEDKIWKYEPHRDKTCLCQTRTIKEQMSRFMRKHAYAKCKQQRRRSAWASTQSDQRLCCSLPNTFNCYICNFKTLASLQVTLGKPVWVIPGRKPRRQVFSWRGSDQPVRQHSLVTTSIVHCPAGSIVGLKCRCYIHYFKSLACYFCSWASEKLIRFQTSDDRFSHDMAQLS